MRTVFLVFGVLAGCTHESRVINGLQRPVHVVGEPPQIRTLRERMNQLGVPSVSIAVFDHDQLDWAQGFGGVKTSTRFPASSISKAVTASATMRLVGEGRLALDANVNTLLHGWQVADSEFTATEKVTLRRLLSHSAGTNMHAVKSFRIGERVPTLIELLKDVHVEAIPGTEFRYSGGGVMIEQLVLEETLKRPFATLMNELILMPFGMHDSEFTAKPEVPAVTPHDAKGTELPTQIHPQLAADGLWTTPIDLLGWAQAIAHARAGQPSVLSKDAATQMLTVQQGPSGLGVFIEGEGAALRFGHEGSDDGFHSELIFFPPTGQGAAVMTNGAGGHALIREVLLAIAAEYHWPGFAPLEVTAIAVRDEAVGVYETTYEDFTLVVTITRVGDWLRVKVPLLAIDSDAVFTDAKTLMLLDSGDAIGVLADTIQIGKVQVPRRIPAVQ